MTEILITVLFVVFLCQSVYIVVLQIKNNDQEETIRIDKKYIKELEELIKFIK